MEEVNVKWDRHGVVHAVSTHLVDYQRSGKAVVWWPNRQTGKPWSGWLTDNSGKLLAMLQLAIPLLYLTHARVLRVAMDQIVYAFLRIILCYLMKNCYYMLQNVHSYMFMYAVTITCNKLLLLHFTVRVKCLCKWFNIFSFFR